LRPFAGRPEGELQIAVTDVETDDLHGHLRGSLLNDG